MSKLYLATLSCASLDEARRLAQGAIQNKIASCASILPWLESYYHWNEKMHAQQETKVLFKLPKKNKESLEKFILDQSSYDVPELLFFEVAHALKMYEQWALTACDQEASMACSTTEDGRQE